MEGTLELRKWTPADAQVLTNLIAGIDRTYLSNRMPDPYTPTHAAWWLDMVSREEGKGGIFRAIVADGTVVGAISIERMADIHIRDAEIGYYLAESVRGRGIMPWAVTEICRIAFRELNLLRITGRALAPNVPSRRVMEKCGFALEGIMKYGAWKRQQVYDVCVYGKYPE